MYSIFDPVLPKTLRLMSFPKLSDDGLGRKPTPSRSPKQTEKSMRKLAAALAVVALISSVTMAEARGGRTTAADCEAGSDDPDCPDAPDTRSKPPPPKAPPPK